MAFSATITSPLSKPERISRSMGIYAGKCSISSYSQTLVTLTSITKYFKPTSNATTGGFAHGIFSVQIDGPSSSGYLAKWDYTTGAFKCFYADKSTSASGTITITGSAAMSAAGVPVLWNQTTGALGNTGTAGTTPVTVSTPANAAQECAADVTIGTFGFIAIGLI